MGVANIHIWKGISTTDDHLNETFSQEVHQNLDKFKKAILLHLNIHLTHENGFRPLYNLLQKHFWNLSSPSVDFSYADILIGDGKLLADTEPIPLSSYFCFLIREEQQLRSHSLLVEIYWDMCLQMKYYMLHEHWPKHWESQIKQLSSYNLTFG